MNVLQKRPVCPDCGSDDVVRDAWVFWDRNSHQWEISEVYGDGYCRQCQFEGDLDWVPDTATP